MKKLRMPPKNTELYVPLLQIQMEREFEEDLLNVVLSYREKSFAQTREGRVFREALRQHFRDPNFPHIWKSPRRRLLRLLKDQWLIAKDFYLTVFWVWKNANQELFEAIEKWLEEHQPESSRIYAAEFADSENREALLCSWAEVYSKETEEQPKIKFVMALVAYLKHHPKTFAKFQEEEEKPAVSSTKVNEDVDRNQSHDSIWEVFLAQIHETPVEQLQLNQLEQFTEQAREVILEKIAEKEKEQRFLALVGQVQGSLAVMSDWESYFRFGDHQLWQVHTADEATLAFAAEKLEEITNHLTHLDDLLKSRPTSLNERRLHEQQVRAAEDSIISTYQRLNQLFANEVPVLTPNQGVIPMVEPMPLETLPSSELIEEPAAEPQPVSPLSHTATQIFTEEIDIPVPDPIEAVTPAERAEAADELEPAAGAPETYEKPLRQIQANNDATKEEVQDLRLAPAEDRTAGLAEVEKTLLSAVKAKNLCLGYWLATGLEQTIGQVIPSWLMAGIQGTYWFLSQWPDTPQALLTEIQEMVDPKNRTIRPEQTILALPMALGLGLFESSAGWQNWLSVELPSSAVNLNKLLLESAAFTQSNLKLEPVIVQNILGTEQAEARIQSLANQAVLWLEQATQKTTRFSGANDVWKRIIGSRGTLHSWFDHVTQDDRDAALSVREKLETWSNRAWLDHHIQKLHWEKHGRVRAIDGDARDQLIFWLLKAAEIAKQWSDLILETDIQSGAKRWLWEQTTQFCDFLKKNLPSSIRETQEMQTQASGQLEMISYMLLEETLHLLAHNLDIKTVARGKTSSSYIVSQSLLENLASVLIYYPELSLKDDGTPQETIQQSDLEILIQTNHSEQEAFELWLRRKNYTFLNTLIDRMPNPVQDEARRRMEDQLTDDIQLVQQEIDKTIVTIEQALVEELISEQEYVATKSNVESILKQLKALSSGNNELEAVNIRLFLEKLHEIQKKLEASHSERLENFRKHWDRLLTILPKFISNKEYHLKVTELVERSFQQKDLRAVTESIAHLDSVVSGNEKLVLDLFVGKSVSYKLREFSAEITAMSQARENDSSLVEEGKKFSRNLPGERRREVQKALDAWAKLKREESRNVHEQNFPLLGTILQYLGWDVSPISPISLVPQPPTGFQHWHVLASPRVPAPVPQFGFDRMKQTSITSRYGLYDVVGAWGRPGFNAIEALIKHMGKKPFILLYFGSMLASQRLDLMRLARKKHQPLIMVDELLLLFLAREYDVRLTAMFDCALPYSSTNPYVPFATGSVPPEMYFGREDKIAALEDQYGPSIVYGGRQLGKSALLRQVQRKFHNPERGQFAVYEDIRLIGDPLSENDYRTEITERLVHALRQGGVLEPSRQFMDINKLADFLIQQIKTKAWRVLLLIDEADMFLEADAGRKFNVVTTLKRVMDQTDRRFKVVFAGLNQVQKFTKTSNQPLAHLGDSIAIQVGPLEPLPAIELIERPLRSLGYVFGKPGQEDPSLIAHILSYTNYHPGLLQLFGQFLVDHLNQKSYGNRQPPYPITRSDIEAVYRNAKVRETIRNRFNITLELDERYEAITLSLILDQWDEKNGFDRLFSPEELLNITREQWPAGFSEEITVFKGILEEMCGLGVLSRVLQEDENVKYRLRSPNLVSLVGNQSEIINRLDVISRSQPISQQRKLESYHAPVEPYFSPLTYAQERMIVGSSSGVCMVFGTQATRINNLSESLEKTARKIGDWFEIKVSARTEATLLEQLKGILRRSKKPIIAFRELDGSSEEMVEQILAAARFCRQTRDQKLRVVFALDAISAWQWFQIPAVRRQEVEQGYLDVLTVLERWDKLSIRQMLEQHEPEITAGEANIIRIYEATGGWPNIMDKFIDLCRGTTDPLPALDKLKKRLLTEPEKKHFRADLGLYDDIRIKTFLDRVLQEPDLRSLTPAEAMDYLFGDEHLEEAQIVLEYLRRLCIVQTTPYLRVEPVAARALYEPQR